MIADVITAFSIGLLGAGHCLGMCGGIATIMSFTATNHAPQQSKLPFIVCYNLGRLISYMLFGALAGSMIASISEYKPMLIWLKLASGIMMVLLALSLGLWWNGLAYIERLGGRLWQYIAPLSHKLLPLRSPLAALPFGFLWGWLPCGMVYSAVSFAALASNTINSAILMFAFGLGTLPAMLLVGTAGETAKKWLDRRGIRTIIAFILMVYALFMLFTSLAQMPMHSHGL